MNRGDGAVGIIGATNDFDPRDLAGRTSSEVVADLVGDAPVVKAANTLAAAVLGTDPREAGGQRVLFLSGDDRDPRMRPRVSADRSISPNAA